MLDHLRRELHELECQAEDATGDDLHVLQVEAADVEAKIREREAGYGMSWSFPVTGEEAA